MYAEYLIDVVSYKCVRMCVNMYVCCMFTYIHTYMNLTNIHTYIHTYIHESHHHVCSLTRHAHISFGPAPP